MTTAATVAALAALLPAGPGDAASPPARVDYHDSFTTQLPGAPAGRAFHDELANPDDPNAKPPATTHVHTELPEGARYDTAAVPACTANDAQLMAVGPSACPPASRVGTNQVTIDSGLPGSGRYAMEDVTFFNEPGGMIIVSHDRASGAYVVLHAKVHGRTFDLDQPPLPGTPPDGGATKSERATLLKAVDAAGRSYITTPPTCPASRIWRFRYTYTFSGGRTQTVTSDQKCLRRRSHRLRVAVRGMPRHCAGTGFTARIRVAGGGPLRDVTVRLDGKLIATRHARRFGVHIDVPALASGRHHVAARVRDATGDSATDTASFLRCYAATASARACRPGLRRATCRRTR